MYSIMNTVKYLYSHLSRKIKKPSGFWKCDEGFRDIEDSFGQTVGRKRTLSYYERTSYRMKEYQLPNNQKANLGVYRIYQQMNESPQPKSHAHQQQQLEGSMKGRSEVVESEKQAEGRTNSQQGLLYDGQWFESRDEWFEQQQILVLGQQAESCLQSTNLQVTDQDEPTVHPPEIVVEDTDWTNFLNLNEQVSPKDEANKLKRALPESFLDTEDSENRTSSQLSHPPRNTDTSEVKLATRAPPDTSFHSNEGNRSTQSAQFCQPSNPMDG